MRYLSPEWLAALQTVAQAVPAGATPAGAALTIEQQVTGGPDGDRTFHVVVADGAVRVASGPAGDATVTFTQDYETATAIATGAESAQAAFMVGRVRVRGDLQALVANQNVLTSLDDLFAAVRRETTY